MNNEVKERVQKEYDELWDKTTKLNEFMATKEYDALDHVHKLLLKGQRNTMIEYLNILELRLQQLGGTPFSLSQLDYINNSYGKYSCW